MKFLGAILVHPVRRQNFAGTGAPYILQHRRLCHTKYIQKYQQWWERKCGEIKPYSFCPGLLLKQTQEEESFTFFIEGAVFIKKSARL